MTDSKYFTTTKKGEIFELKSELNSDKKEKKREAVKKVSFFKSFKHRYMNIIYIYFIIQIFIFPNYYTMQAITL